MITSIATSLKPRRKIGCVFMFLWITGICFAFYHIVNITLDNVDVYLTFRLQPSMHDILTVHSNYEIVQEARIKRIKYFCARPELIKSENYKGQNDLQYYYSDKYNFSYCKVPKVGCTFLSQIFAILKNDTADAKGVFNEQRNKVHDTLTSKFAISFEKVVQQDIETILVSRDPYSRLFSAFIDKMYFPIMSEHWNKVLQFAYKSTHDITANPCPNNVTFERFVRWITAEAKNGQTLNEHWAPIYSLCKPCDVKIRILVKLESFSKDVEYALREVGVDIDTLSTITDAMHAHRIEATIPGIVSTVQTFAQDKIVTDCYNSLDVAERIWRSFQIQGFIIEKVRFPKEMLINMTIDGGLPNYKVLTDVILKTIRQHPLTSDESKQQRKRALVNAYSTFSPDTLQGIRDVYYDDFVLYNYSIVPPLMESSCNTCSQKMGRL